MFAEDRKIFLREFSASCSIAGQTFLGIFNKPGDQSLMAGVNVQITWYSVLMDTADCGALQIKSKSIIVVDGASYEVRDVTLDDADGAFTNLTLSKL